MPVIVSYSMPFVLFSALIINNLLQANGIAGSPFRLPLLSTSFPIGFSIGRAIYLRLSHIRIEFDSVNFSVVKGSKEVINDFWRTYRNVSIILDRYGRPNLRLYKSLDGEYFELPISKTNAKPQEFRSYVQNLLASRRSQRVSPQVVEAA